MKKITYFNVLVFTVLLLTMGGCNEDKFLKEDPRDALYPENLLVDYNGFKSMITPLYGLVGSEMCIRDRVLCVQSIAVLMQWEEVLRSVCILPGVEG